MEPFLWCRRLTSVSTLGYITAAAHSALTTRVILRNYLLRVLLRTRYQYTQGTQLPLYKTTYYIIVKLIPLGIYVLTLSKIYRCQHSLLE